MGTKNPDYPEMVVFEEHDGLYWLDSRGASALANTTGVTFNGTRVGFDQGEAMARSFSLMKQGITVAVLRGDRLRTVRLPSRSARAAESKLIFLAPELLMDEGDLDRLARCLERSGCAVKRAYERWQAELAAGAEPPAIYITEMAGLYDVDWEKAALSKESFEALALAAWQAARQLPCLLTVPLRKRKLPIHEESQVFGQLALNL